MAQWPSSGGGGALDEEGLEGVVRDGEDDDEDGDLADWGSRLGAGGHVLGGG